MNQAQTKFAINRVYSILALKFKALAVEDKLKYVTVSKKTKLAHADVADLIKKGTLKLASKAKLNKETGEITLRSLFDFVELDKKSESLRKKLNINEKKRLELCNTTKDHCYTFDYFNLADIILKVEKLIQVFDTTCDAIMLSSNEEALKAIKEIEAMQF